VRARQACIFLYLHAHGLAEGVFSLVVVRLVVVCLVVVSLVVARGSRFAVKSVSFALVEFVSFALVELVLVLLWSDVVLVWSLFLTIGSVAIVATDACTQSWYVPCCHSSYLQGRRIASVDMVLAFRSSYSKC
jgi:hypothetical protein